MVNAWQINLFEVDVKKVMKTIPATTDSVLSPGKNYKDYTFKELKQLMVD